MSTRGQISLVYYFGLIFQKNFHMSFAVAVTGNVDATFILVELLRADDGAD